MKRHFEGSTVGDDASAAGLAHMRLHSPAEPKDWGSDKVYGQRAGLVVPASAWCCCCSCFAVLGRRLVHSGCNNATPFATSPERPHVEVDQMWSSFRARKMPGRCGNFVPSLLYHLRYGTYRDRSHGGGAALYKSADSES